MQHRQIALVPLLLSGCALAQPLGQNATLILKPQIIEPRQTQAEVVLYGKASIDHLKLELFSGQEGETNTGAFLTIKKADLETPVVFSHLRANTHYRIKALAYLSDNTQISVDASSSIEITLTNDNAPTLANIPVTLKDSPFEGTASSSLVFNTGKYVPTGAENMNFLGIEGIVSTLAGSGLEGATDSLGTSASFLHPYGIVVDAQENVYITDNGNHLIRKIAPNGQVSPLAGNGGTAFADGVGTAATFYSPIGITLDINGNLFVADFNHHRIRKIATNGAVTTVAGNGATSSVDGVGTAASFNNPIDLIFDSTGNLYVSEYVGNRIRKIAPNGTVTTVAGNGSAAFNDGIGTAASFNAPGGLVFDKQGNLYIGDRSNHRIRKLAPSGLVTTVAGNDNSGCLDGVGAYATFMVPHGLAMDSYGNIYIGDYQANRIRKLAPNGTVTTVAGNGSASYADGTGIQAMFHFPHGVAMGPLGNLYVTEYIGNRIRKIR